MKVSFKRFRTLFAGTEQQNNSDPREPDGSGLFQSETQLEEYMVRNKPYLLSRYSLYQLSDETGIPLSELTTILDRRQSPSFRDFIDGYRIRYCIEVLKRIPLRTISLFDLSVICGFDDQQEFCAAFKKISRISVSEYVRKVYRGRLSTSRLGSIHFFIFLLIAITALHILKYVSSQPLPSTVPTENKKALPKEGGPITPAMKGPVANSFHQAAHDLRIEN